MGTFFKYLIYVLVLIALYIVGRGIYIGNINKSTTLNEIISQVDDGTKNIAKEAANIVGKAMQD